MAIDVDVPFPVCAHGPVKRIHAPCPRRLQHALVLLVWDASHPVPATQIVNAVHARPPDAGALTFATPTIASRVNNSTSWLSDIPSVPSGRSGSTRYRISAVLSHT